MKYKKALSLGENNCPKNDGAELVTVRFILQSAHLIAVII